ncbi:MAG: hypothetical protein AAF458_17825, partial [Pseudomonadota bacterium]
VYPATEGQSSSHRQLERRPQGLPVDLRTSPLKRVFKSSGATADEVEAMRAALDAANIEFEERPGSVFGGGQAGLWVADVEAARRAQTVISAAQAEWVERVRRDPQSVETTSIFGTNKAILWWLLIVVVILNLMWFSALF